jgi:hypothetical protein
MNIPNNPYRDSRPVAQSTMDRPERQVAVAAAVVVGVGAVTLAVPEIILEPWWRIRCSTLHLTYLSPLPFSSSARHEGSISIGPCSGSAPCVGKEGVVRCGAVRDHVLVHQCSFITR